MVPRRVENVKVNLSNTLQNSSTQGWLRWLSGEECLPPSLSIVIPCSARRNRSCELSSDLHIGTVITCVLPTVHSYSLRKTYSIILFKVMPCTYEITWRVYRDRITSLCLGCGFSNWTANAQPITAKLDKWDLCVAQEAGLWGDTGLGETAASHTEHRRGACSYSAKQSDL